jgi:hypothetical protein
LGSVAEEASFFLRSVCSSFFLPSLNTSFLAPLTASSLSFLFFATGSFSFLFYCASTDLAWGVLDAAILDGVPLALPTPFYLGASSYGTASWPFFSIIFSSSLLWFSYNSSLAISSRFLFLVSGYF